MFNLTVTTFNITTFKQAQEFLTQYIPRGVKQVFAEDAGLRRAETFLSFLDNPQDKLKVIHIAGTSGKGSTSHFISQLLRSQGFNVGLSISPHLLDVRERMQINHNLISEQEFCAYLTELIPAVEKMKQTEFKMPTYFEITTALAFYTFWKKKVDYAVMETGLGGLYDATNTVHSKDKLCVITKIGFDHMKILGRTLPKIAFQKISITQKGNTVLSIDQKTQVKKVFEEVTSQKQAKLHFITSPTNFSHIQVKDQNVTFDFRYNDVQFSQLAVSIPALYQAENASLALAAISHLSKRDNFTINEEKLRESLQHVSVPGRMEVIQAQNQSIIIDGAHNPQKMKAFITSLKAKYPQQKFIFLISFKKEKDFAHMLSYIAPLADKIIITSFGNKTQGMVVSSIQPTEIAHALETMKFSNYEIIEDSHSAFEKTLSLQQQVVITGSFYLISELYSLLQKLK